MSAPVVAQLLRFMYTGQLEISPQSVQQVLAGARRLRMRLAVFLCERYLSNLQGHSQSTPNEDDGVETGMESKASLCDAFGEQELRTTTQCSDGDQASRINHLRPKVCSNYNSLYF